MGKPASNLSSLATETISFQPSQVELNIEHSDFATLHRRTSHIPTNQQIGYNGLVLSCVAQATDGL